MNTMESRSKVDMILTSLYNEVYILEDWINFISSNIILPPLIQPQDSKSYTRLLKTTKVCIKSKECMKQLPNRFSPTQNFHQQEIVMRVIERILKKDGKSTNVIVLGFSLKSDSPDARVSMTSNIQHNYPNSCVNRLQYSSWCLLLSRIGDNVMSYLLENTSIFLQIADTTCLVQVTGEGIHDLLLKHKDKNLTSAKSKLHYQNVTFKRKQAKKLKKRVTKKKKMLFTSIKPKSTDPGTIYLSSLQEVVDLVPGNETAINEPSSCHLKQMSLPVSNIPQDTEITETQNANSSVDCLQSSNALNQVDKHTKLTCLSGNVLPIELSTKTDHLLSQNQNQSTKNCEEKKDSNVTEKYENYQLSKTPDSLCSGSGTLFESSESWFSKDALNVVGLKHKSQEEQPVSKRQKLAHEPNQSLISMTPECYFVSSTEELLVSSQDFNIQQPLDPPLKDHQDVSSSQEQGFKKLTFQSALKRKRSLSLSDLGGVPKLSSKLTQTVSSQNDQKSATCQTDFKPFDFHQPIRRIDILCGKSVREKIPKLGNTEDIYKTIVSKAVGCKTTVDHSPISTSLKYILDKLLVQYHKCPWFTLLNYHCPTTKYSQYRYKTTRKKKEVKNTAKLLESFAPHNQVYLFLKIIIRKIVPEELFGNGGNRNIFLKNVLKYVKLGRYEGLCLGQVMSAIKIKQCTWLKYIKCPTTKAHILSQLFLWLFNDFIAVALKSFFYITESNNYRNMILYYRKSIWQQLYLQSFQAFKEKCHLKLISTSEVERLLRSKKALGIGHLKFLPKVRSCRPIINMGKNLNFPGIYKTIPVNKQLLNLLQVLTSYKDNHPEVLGSSVFGSDDVYHKLKRFIQYRKNHSDTRELYFVKTDITNCFDTIRPDKIYSIISHHLNQRSEEFITRKYFCVFTAGGKIRRSVQRNSQSLSDYNPDFFSFSKDRINKSNLRNLIFVDMVVNDHDSPSNLLSQLHCLLFNNVIKIGKVYYKQEGGISQGSNISTLLSNYYYGDMEKEMMSILSDELLMRMVDDFLYITPYKHKAVQFLTYIWKGNKEYNCYVNPDKIMTNFTCSVEDKTVLSSNTEEFCWCGYEINTTTLNISAEYKRHQGLDVKDMMTIETGRKPGIAMKNKLMLSIRPKCHSLFLDDKINSEATIVRNISHLFQLTAVKFHCHHRNLPHKQRSQNNTAYFYNMILSLCSYMNNQGKFKLSKLNSTSILSLSLLQITWIGVYSFIQQLTVYHSQYHLLLKFLNSKFKSVSNKVVRYFYIQ